RREALVREGGPPEGLALPRDEVHLRDRGALRRRPLPVVLGAVPRRLGRQAVAFCLFRPLPLCDDPSVVELSIGIAGLRTAVVTRDPDVATVVRDRYEGFLSTGPADWRIEISPPSGGVPFSKDVVVRRDGGPARFSVRRHDFAGTVDVSERTADVRLTVPTTSPSTASCGSSTPWRSSRLAGSSCTQQASSG